MATYRRPDSIKDLAVRLSDLGYWPVPIPAGCKGPTLKGWQDLRLNFETAPDYFEPGMLVGILHKNVLAIDVDVYDEDLSRIIVDEALRRFPGALERIGQAPKSALFLRMEEPGFKVGNTEKHERTDEETGEVYSAQVEIRSVTRQIVAYGKHPDTGKPYRWPRGELWETPLGDLPEAKKDEIEQFRDWCNDQIRKWAGISDPKVTDFSLYSTRAISFNDERPSEEFFRKALAHIPASVGYDEWLAALMSIHDYYGGSGAGLSIAQEWSKDYPDYNAREVETKWRSFEVGKGRSYKSLLWQAKQNGADLSAMRREERGQDFRIEGPSLSDDLADDFDIYSPPEPDAPRRISQLEWFGDVRPALTDNYLIKDVLAQGAMSVVYGPSNSGKTFFVLDMMFHLAAGNEWRRRRTVPAAVLYLAAEGGRGIANRIAALREHTGAQDVALALRRGGLDLLKSEADLQAVYDFAAEVHGRYPDRPLVIVIDTLSRVMAGGDENGPADMTQFIKNVDMIREKTGAHICIVHHSGKDAARGARGHSSLRAATDTEIEIEEPAEDSNARMARDTKQRDYTSHKEFAFALQVVELGEDQDGDDVTSCVVIEADAGEVKRAKKKPSKNQRLILECFDMLLAEGRGRPNPGGDLMPEPGRFMGMDVSVLSDAFHGKYQGQNPHRAFSEAIDGLTEPGGVFGLAYGFVWHLNKRVS